MRQLLIVRHAVAYERNATRWPDDALRPLTDRGKRKFRRTARQLSDILDRPDELLTSTLKRARQTARILRREAGFPKPVELRELAPDAAIAPLIAALGRRRGQRLAIVGHEPQLSALVSDLLGGMLPGRVPLKKGGVVLLGFDGPIAAGKAQLLLFAAPSALRR